VVVDTPLKINFRAGLEELNYKNIELTYNVGVISEINGRKKGWRVGQLFHSNWERNPVLLKVWAGIIETISQFLLLSSFFNHWRKGKGHSSTKVSGIPFRD